RQIRCNSGGEDIDDVVEQQNCGQHPVRIFQPQLKRAHLPVHLVKHMLGLQGPERRDGGLGGGEERGTEHTKCEGVNFDCVDIQTVHPTTPSDSSSCMIRRCSASINCSSCSFMWSWPHKCRIPCTNKKASSRSRD